MHKEKLMRSKCLHAVNFIWGKKRENGFINVRLLGHIFQAIVREKTVSICLAQDIHFWQTFLNHFGLP